MAMVSVSLLEMMVFMRVNISTEEGKTSAHTSGPRVKSIKESIKTTREKASASIDMPMAIFMKVFKTEIKTMQKVRWYIQADKFMKVSGTEVVDKATVY